VDTADKTGLTDACDILTAMFLEFLHCLPQLGAKKLFLLWSLQGLVIIFI